MKRLHLHVGVKDLAQAIQFYSTLFAANPSITKPDYAKWILDDPHVNFAITSGADDTNLGIDHVGIQAETSTELNEIADRLKQAGENTFDEAATNCCYAISDKTWVQDPSGVRWETFFTHGEATQYGEDASRDGLSQAADSKTQTPGCGCC